MPCFFCAHMKKACSDVRAAHVMEFPKSVFSACYLSPGYKGTHSDSTVPVLYSHTSKHCLNNPGKYTQKQAGLRQLSWLKNTWPFMTSQDIFLSCLEVKRKARQKKKKKHKHEQDKRIQWNKRQFQAETQMNVDQEVPRGGDKSENTWTSARSHCPVAFLKGSTSSFIF